jgi:succinate dehydrogenase/fumarate reductase flavoprotein subunit
MIESTDLVIIGGGLGGLAAAALAAKAGLHTILATRKLTALRPIGSSNAA